MTAFDMSCRPLLAAHVRLKIDPIEGQPLLLYPEGMLVLNDTAHEIVRRCDGRTTLTELLRSLTEEFDADREVLRRDLIENLETLRGRNLLLFAP
jgi:pyrroloquinoline quinone biosynthesis protein D